MPVRALERASVTPSNISVGTPKRAARGNKRHGKPEPTDFVVGDGLLGDAEVISPGLLGEAGLLAQLRETAAEVWSSPAMTICSSKSINPVSRWTVPVTAADNDPANSRSPNPPHANVADVWRSDHRDARINASISAGGSSP